MEFNLLYYSSAELIELAALVGYKATDAWDAQEAIADGYLMHLEQIWRTK